MSNITYIGLLNGTLECYTKNGSLEAYQYITKNADKVTSGNKAQLYNFKYALASASGLEKEALHIMKEAIIENKFWYGYEYLMTDDDLKPLHKHEEFHQMVQLCKEREEVAKKSEQVHLKLIQGNSGIYNNLFISLHGDQENMKIAAPYWQSVVPHGYLLALPQSSQIQFSEGYVWDHVEKGSRELKEHYESIIANNHGELDHTIIGGFSAGARVALHTILKENIKVKGFIFVAPWLPEVEEWEKLLNTLKDRGIKGYIVCGDQDEDCFECTQKFVALLKKKNIAYKYKVIEGLKHDYPENFEEILQEAIRYIEDTDL
ncbi:alpha/beta hydrolase [Bacillus sp. Xin]|uniref:alpha/beta hydrolase n=1 Tax=unclassified Bacillus (in: firmicutes) TaxID=185979 RepID=UPI0015746B9A|nr:MULTISPECIES: alpha/beta hydrolase [unclassified Bacillus (in: firmicutes)]MBC6972297.1 alpha/beta hydrolase [Bacillus sp. Xin]NSW38194.1 alpha/beta hydrolase [Bacillus sp. Xin1]